MYNLLVLGLVPGTAIQISFQDWLAMAGLLLAVAVVLRGPIKLKRRLRVLQAAAGRLPLHASQLHQRLNLTAR